MVGWPPSRSKVQNPFLLRPDCSKAATTADQAELLLDAQLPCNSVNLDVTRTQATSSTPTSAGRWTEITADEIEKVVLQIAPKAPDFDCISTDVSEVC